MKYCSKCGAELNDEAVICTKCGCSVGEVERKQESASGLAIAALVFSILGGWIGLLLDIIGLCTLKGEQDRKYCKIGLIISIVFVVIEIIAIIAIVVGAASLADSMMQASTLFI